MTFKQTLHNKRRKQQTTNESKQLSTMSQNPTLIAGFEDVLTYIRQQDERIKRLEKEVAEKEEMTRKCQTLNGKLHKKIDNLRKQTCCADGEELEDRIGEIIQTKNNYRDALWDCDGKERLTAEKKKWMESHAKWVKECERLKEENKKLEDFSNWENHPALRHKVVLDDDYYLQHCNDDHGGLIHPDYVSEIEQENEKLKEKIEEWKESCSGYVNTPDELETWMSAAIHEDDEEYSKYVEPLELREEVEKLKEEIKFANQLREASRKQDYRAQEKGRERLAEIEKLKEEIKATADFWQCLMDCRGNPDNPDKQEIDEWCDAYNKSDKVRKSLYASAGVN